MPEIHTTRTLKSTREALCVASGALGRCGQSSLYDAQMAALNALIDDIDRQRPLGANGKHGDRHTPTCGCDDVEPSPEHTPMTDAELEQMRRSAAEHDEGLYGPEAARQDEVDRLRTQNGVLVTEVRFQGQRAEQARADYDAEEVTVGCDIFKRGELRSVLANVTASRDECAREAEALAAKVDRLRAELERVHDMRAAEADEYVRQLRARPGWCRACPPGCAECLGPDCECYEHDEAARWRVGRSVGRTIYAIVGDEPSDRDRLIGVMDTPELARAAVDAHNALLSWEAATMPPPGEDGGQADGR